VVGVKSLYIEMYRRGYWALMRAKGCFAVDVADYSSRDPGMLHIPTSTARNVKAGYNRGNVEYMSRY